METKQKKAPNRFSFFRHRNLPKAIQLMECFTTPLVKPLSLGIKDICHSITNFIFFTKIAIINHNQQ